MTTPEHILRDAASASLRRAMELIDRTTDVFGPSDPTVVMAVADGVVSAGLGAFTAALRSSHTEEQVEEMLRAWWEVRIAQILDQVEIAVKQIKKR